MVVELVKVYVFDCKGCHGVPFTLKRSLVWLGDDMSYWKMVLCISMVLLVGAVAYLVGDLSCR